MRYDKERMIGKIYIIFSSYYFLLTVGFINETHIINSIMPSKVRNYSAKLVILGNPKVGKTSLRRSYLGKSFQTNYLSTISADFSILPYQMNKTTKVTAQIWDIAGQSLYDATHPKYFMGSHSALIVFDVTNRESFESVHRWFARFDELSNSAVTITIVGNKIDLEELITEEEQKDLVDILKQKYPRYEILNVRTSAKVGTNIIACVQETIHSLVSKNEQSSQKKENKTPPLNDIIPACYISTFDNLKGPRVLKKSPDTEITELEFMNSMKISSLIDDDLLANMPHVEGTTPWQVPVGYLYYIAFINVLKRVDTDATYIIGIVVNRNYHNFFQDKYDIVSGYLHTVMNVFNKNLLDLDGDYDLISQPNELDIHLLQLRQNVYNLIKEGL